MKGIFILPLIVLGMAACTPGSVPERAHCIRFSVTSEVPRTKMMISSEDDLRLSCTPVGSKYGEGDGEGKAIGVWADMTDPDGKIVKDVYNGVALKWFPREGGHEDNPTEGEKPERSYWNTDGDVYWRQGETYTFRAYYPAGIELKENTSAVTFIAEYQAEKVQEDLMVAYKKIILSTSNLDTHVDLHLRHMLSAVKFTFRFKDDFVAEDRLTGMWIENTLAKDGFCDYGMLLFGDGTPGGEEAIKWYDIYSPAPGVPMYKWTISPGLPFSNSSSSRAVAYTGGEGVSDGTIYTTNRQWVYMIPQELGKKAKICFTTQNGGGSVFKVDLPSSFERGGTVVNSLEPGNRYQFDIVITKLDMEAFITILPWNERESAYTINL